MTILHAMQSASTRLIGRKPTSFFSSTNVFEQELVDLVNEVAQDCVASDDWQDLIKICDITGDGVTEDFDFPLDYGSQTTSSDIQNLQDWAWGYEHVTDINDFIFRRARGFQPFPGAWIIYGGKLHFTPAPAVGNSASFPYVSSYYAKASGGTLKAAFDADDDSFLLSERMLTLGLIWRWRENKKLDYTGDMEAFQKCVDDLANRDKGSQVIRRGRRANGRFSIAYPWALGS